jgi:hypothetical protein
MPLGFVLSEWTRVAHKTQTTELALPSPHPSRRPHTTRSHMHTDRSIGSHNIPQPLADSNTRLIYLRVYDNRASSFKSTKQWTFPLPPRGVSAQLKTKVGITLTKDAPLRVNLNIDGSPITSRTHTHPSHSQTSRLLTSSLSLGVPVPRTTQCMRDV